MSLVPVTPGWDFVMGVYRPGRSALDGSYLLPAAVRLCVAGRSPGP